MLTAGKNFLILRVVSRVTSGRDCLLLPVPLQLQKQKVSGDSNQVVLEGVGPFVESSK